MSRSLCVCVTINRRKILRVWRLGILISACYVYVGIYIGERVLVLCSSSF